jgi:hypothetical protein
MLNTWLGRQDFHEEKRPAADPYTYKENPNIFFRGPAPDKVLSGILIHVNGSSFAQFQFLS